MGIMGMGSQCICGKIIFVFSLLWNCLSMMDDGRVGGRSFKTRDKYKRQLGIRTWVFIVQMPICMR